MPQIFIAKIRQNNCETLIFCNENSFAPVSTYIPHAKTLDNLLCMRKKDLQSIKFELNQKLPAETEFLNLVESQYIFATGFTYEWPAEKLNSMDDRDIYKRLYLSKRPIVFMKGSKKNLAYNHQNIKIRKDSTFTIPETELVAVFNSFGEIIGHTLGNDVTAVDLEKEHPMFQMQGKFYEGSVALLPLIKLTTETPRTNLRCQVIRGNETVADLNYSSEQFIKNEDHLVLNVHQLGLTKDGGFLFLGCNAHYPEKYALAPGDKVIVSSDFFPMSLENGCQWLEIQETI